MSISFSLILTSIDNLLTPGFLLCLHSFARDFLSLLLTLAVRTPGVFHYLMGCHSLPRICRDADSIPGLGSESHSSWLLCLSTHPHDSWVLPHLMVQEVPGPSWTFSACGSWSVDSDAVAGHAWGAAHLGVYWFWQPPQTRPFWSQCCGWPALVALMIVR